MKKWNDYLNYRFKGGNAGKSVLFGIVSIVIIAITALMFSACPGLDNLIDTNDSVPGAPTGLTATPAPNMGATTGRIMLKWEQPATGYINGDGTPGTISTYTVYYSKTNDFTNLTAFLDTSKHVTNNAFTRVEITGLDDATQYFFVVTATNEEGEGQMSTYTSVTTAAAAPALESVANDQPTNFKVEAGDGSIKVTWDLPLDPGVNSDGRVGTSTTLKYKVSYKESTQDDSEIIGPESIDVGTEYTITSLINEKEYTVYLWAENGSGLFDADVIVAVRQMLFVTPTAPVAADPAVVTGKVGNKKAILSWPKPFDGRATINKYIVYWGDSTPVDTTDSNVNKKQIDVDGNTPEPVETKIVSLTNDTTYYFVVLTFNGYDADGKTSTTHGTPSNTVEVTPTAVAPEVAPGNVKVESTGVSGQIKVSWDAVEPANNGGDAVTGYKIYYATTAEGVTKTAAFVDVSESGTLFKIVDGFDDGKDYYFKVSAYNSKGESELSASEVSTQAVIGTAPEVAPGNVKVESTGVSGQIKVSWDAVEPANNGGADISSYKIYYAASPGVTNAANFEETTDSNMFKIINVGDNSIRYFRVSAVNSIGESELSDEFQGQAQEGFTVTFEANATGVSGTIAPTKVPSNGVIATAPTGFTKAGHYISGWNTQTDGTGTDFIFGVAGTGTAVNNHLTLYAQWSTDASSEPGAPTGIAFTSVEQRSVLVSWTAPSSPGTIVNGNDDTINYYTVYYSDSTISDNPAASVSRKLTTTGVATSLAIDSLTPGTTYNFRVSATNNKGEGTLSSEEAQATLSAASAPGQPALPTASATKTTITVTWVAPAPGVIEDGSTPATITAYKVYWSGSTFDNGSKSNTDVYAVQINNASQREYKINPSPALTPGTNYFIAVAAINAYDEGSISTILSQATQSDSALPGAPGDPGMQSRTTDSITIEWTEPSDTGKEVTGHKATIIDYTIYWSNSSFSSPGDTGVSVIPNVVATSKTFNTLSEGTSYYYAIAARNNEGPGPISGVVTIKTLYDPIAPGQPGNVSVAASGVAGSGEVTVTWKAPTEYGKDAEGTVYKTLEYDVYSSDTDDFSNFSNVTKEGTSSGNSLIINFQDGGTIYFAVVARNAALSGPVSDSTNMVVVIDKSTKPGQPTAPVSNIQTTTTITITWNEPGYTGVTEDGSTSATITAYKLYWSASSFDSSNKGSKATSIDITDPNTKTYTLNPSTPLTPGTTYYFAVAALNAKGEGAISTVISQSTEDSVATPPGQPAFPTSPSQTPYTIEVQWTAPSNTGLEEDGTTPAAITGYRLYWHTSTFNNSNKNTTKFIDTDANTTTFNVGSVGEELTPKTVYFFAVAARNASGEGPISQVLSNMTNEGPTRPGKPTNVLATDTGTVGAGGVEVNWTAPDYIGVNNRGVAYSSLKYDVYYSTSDDFSNLQAVTKGGTDLTVTTVTLTLQAGDLYYIAVVAKNNALSGHVSDSTNIRVAGQTTAPSQPGAPQSES